MSNVILQKEKSEYIILTKDHSKILAGQGVNYHFENTADVFGARNGKIRTYRSRKVAENLILEYNMQHWLPDLYNELYENEYWYGGSYKDKYRKITIGVRYNEYTGKAAGTYEKDAGWTDEAKQLMHDELYKHYDILEVKLSYVEVNRDE